MILFVSIWLDFMVSILPELSIWSFALVWFLVASPKRWLSGFDLIVKSISRRERCCLVPPGISEYSDDVTAW